MRFVLASASPARFESLTAAGLAPDVLVSDVDEDALTRALPDATPGELVVSLANAKATVIAMQVDAPALVLACDSMLEFDGGVLGKPGSTDEAMRRWQQMRGRSGVLHTGHCLINVADGRTVSAAASTVVHFADATDDEIAAYCATGEPNRVAGAFTIDGLGGWFVDHIEGDHHNVVGVSLPVVRRMLAELGFDLAALGYPASR